MSEAGGADTATAAAPSPARTPAPAPGRRLARVLMPLLLAGAVHALAFAPGNLPWLELLALAVALHAGLQAPGARAGALRGFAFGLGWFGVGLYWIYISLHRYGELAAPLAVLATLALAALLALLPAAALAVAAALTPGASVRRAGAVLASWTLAEWLRGVVFTGMPWLATGYAHTDGPLAGYAPVLGVYGVGAMAALVVLAPLLSWPPRPGARRPTAMRVAALALALALLAGGQVLRLQSWSQPYGNPLRVRLVQGNIAQDVKFGEAGLDDAVSRYLPPLRTGAGELAPQLIVLPESAFPVPWDDLPDDLLRVLADPRERSGAALIFGVFIREPRARYFNSALGLDGAGQAPQRYSKRHLVPFGEFIPFGFHWFVDLLNIPIGDQQQGEEFQAPMALAGQRIAVNICFEDLFGAQILDAWHDPQREPTVLLNLSNLAWFDDSTALPQHLQISRMRALETARPLLRATNTGITAVIDAQGRVTAQMAPLTQGQLDATVQGTSGNTPFSRTGNRPILLVSAALLLLCAVMRRSAAPLAPGH